MPKDKIHLKRFDLAAAFLQCRGDLQCLINLAGGASEVRQFALALQRVEFTDEQGLIITIVLFIFIRRRTIKSGLID